MTTQATHQPAPPAELAARPVRFAIVGAGGMGATHAIGIKDDPNVEIAWMVDLDLPRAEQLAHKTGAKATSSMEDALADPAVDAVVIALPTSLHRNATEAAARAGKHVFCEKPIARNAEDGLAMVAACEQAGVTLMIGHVVRFFPEYQRIKEILDSGELGQIATVRALRTNPPVQERSPWFADVEKNGGVVLDLMVHDLDTLCWLLGGVERLFAQGLTYTEAQPRRDYAMASLRFRDGAIAHVESSWAHSTHRTSIEIAGQYGLIDFSSDNAASLTIERTVALSDKLDRPARVYSRPAVVSPQQRELRHFIDCLQSGEPVMIDGHAGVRAITLANSVLDSMRTGRPVFFNEDGSVAA
ncbi:MAG: Gfo/Idh/MocA family oxidoreductase [Chloroflexia bacterium]|nr:Gfo/Idh/MocA family oxidoreductase [Chloroflexia bacterium]